MTTYVLQTRWIGSDDWTNAVFVGATQAEAEAKALKAHNAEMREEAEEEGTEWTEAESLAALADAGEFHFLGWAVED